MDPNIFPMLTHVYEVIVEPWNAEFGCSQLTRLRYIKVIESLSCNGTNGTANGKNSNIRTPSTSSGISTPMTAGIGVGAGLGALLVAALVYRIVYYRRKARAPPTRGGDGPPRKADVIEPNCAALDGNQIVEVNSTCLPHQMGGAEVVEASGVQIPAEAKAERVSGGRTVSPGQERSATPAELA